MHRLFVAIQPPRAVRDRLRAMMGGVPHARWQSDEQLHLTLRFIGEVDHHQATDIAVALGQIHLPRFSLALDGIGQFDRRGRIDALWIGVRPHDPLKALHNKIDQALVRVGLAPETRAYLPHITLARFGRHAGTLGHLPLQAGIAAGVSFEVSDFCLYESVLSHEGSSYTIVERYALAHGFTAAG
ncbi:MAG: RNA 2',3'-cyclic phosphodiesterase [Sphingomonadaceae bacterium]|nr:RNA 2',3'-cyclic phosphodiesterase [Sphingomonadaceae bacterium]